MHFPWVVESEVVVDLGELARRSVWMRLGRLSIRYIVSEVRTRLKLVGWRVGRSVENEDQEPEKNLREML